MKAKIAKALVYLALANLIAGLFLLFLHGYTVMPLIDWIEKIPRDDRAFVIAFFSKLQIAFALGCLAVGALLGFKPK
jgi:hypothetical protein